MKLYRRVAAYVDLDAIEANFEAMRRNLPADTKITAVIKTDGYGHGAVPIARLMESKEYIWGFAVATMEEAEELWRAGIRKPVLILGYLFPEAYEGFPGRPFRPTIFRLDMARELSDAFLRWKEREPGLPGVKVHVKVDTGMSRIGFADRPESIELLQKIRELPGIELEGLFTHFARADEADKTSANRQFERFLDFAGKCREAGIPFELYHCSNSAGILEMSGACLNMVRAGIISYGLYPSDEVDRKAISLKPAMELKSYIVHIKEIEAGTEVSYGGTYRADSVRRIATVPVGYGDGYPRSLSNKGCVLVCGKRAPIRGRVCMDQLMVDVTEIPEAQIGMEVTLFGQDQGKELLLEELCDLSGRFCYEFVCDLNKRVPRIYRKDGREKVYTSDFFGNT